MSHEEESDIIDHLETLGKLAGLIKITIGGAVAIGACLLATAGWVWTINATCLDHAKQLDRISPSVQKIEMWKATTEATPRINAMEIHTIDKRLQRVEDQYTAILEQLKKIDSKLPPGPQPRCLGRARGLPCGSAHAVRWFPE